MGTNGSKFNLGRIVATPGALDAFEKSGDDFRVLLSRHASGDWGKVCKADWQENEFALGKYLRLFSVYHLRDDTKVWIITEADRSVTTILLPSEY